MDKSLVSVVMTTYNVENYINRAIDSILKQTHENLELLIVDDNSKDGTIDKIKKYNDPRIKLFRNNINAGTYFSKNYGITQSKGEFIAIQDSDDFSSPVRIERQLNHFETNPRAVIVKCQYVRVNSIGKTLTEPKAAFQASLIRKRVYEEMGYYDTVRVAGDDEFDSRAKIFYGRERVQILPELYYYNLQRDDSLTSTVTIGGEERVSYVTNYRAWHKKHLDSPEKLTIPYPQTKRKFNAHPKISVKNTTLTKDRFSRIKTNADKVTASLASFPKREEQLKKVIQDILPQVDALKVYLNEFKAVPKFLLKDKITVYLGIENWGDIADNGKLYKIENLTGYHLTIDDDIHYPEDYVSSLKNCLKENSFNCIAGVHGIDILYESFKNYYDLNSRRVYTYNKALKQNTQVHILGTGTVGYHTSSFRPNLIEVNKPFMLDIFFAIQANREGLPMICVKREKDWIKDYETNNNTKIYTKFRNDDKGQSKLVLDYVLDKPYESTIKKANIKKDNLQEYVEKVNGLTNQLNEFKLKTDFQTRKTTLLEKQLDKITKEREWYARTYDHLPLTFLKVGAIFRKIKVKKGFE